MAIGKDGQNVRLTAKLTGWRIEVEGNGTISAPEEKVEEPAPAPVVKKITKTKAKKLAKKAKAAAMEEPKADGPEEVVGEESKVKVPEMKVEAVKEEPVAEEVKSEDNK
jgi:hypothetical protein